MDKGDSRGPAALEGLCPGCERFIGPADVCPYCGADAFKRPGLRFLRRAALLLALLGLAFLYLAAGRRELPLVRIADITPLMNYASVRVAGAAVGKPYVSRRNGAADYAAFTLDDGSGRLRVTADGATARALVERRLLPDSGSRAAVSGRLSVSADGGAKLRLQSADQLVTEGGGAR
jgi:hypothetical protein